MKILSYPACILAVLLAATAAGLAAPVNDNFANATSYTGASMSADTTSATAELGEPKHRFSAPSHSVWWKFVPALSGEYQLDLSASTFDTVIALYTGAKVTALTKLATDDDSGTGSTSLLRVYLTKGVAYAIAVEGYSAANTGNVALAITLASYTTTRTYQSRIASFDQDDGGMVTLTTAPSGAVTGKLLLGSKSYPFTGAIDDAGVLHTSVARTGLLPVSLVGTVAGTVALTLPAGITGTIRSGPMTCSIVVGQNSLNFSAYPTAPGDKNLAMYNPSYTAYSATNPCPRAGYYTMMVNSSTMETGYGIATLKVSTTGLCTGTGKLGDGTAISFGGPLLETTTPLGTGGKIVFHLPLYAGRGRATVELAFDASISPTRIDGACQWLRVSKSPNSVTYGNDNGCSGGLYTPPAPSTRVHSTFDPAGVAILEATKAGVSIPSQSMTLSPQNVFTYAAPNSNLVSLKIVPATGLVTGKVKQVGDTSVSTISAVIINHPVFSISPIFGFTLGSSGAGSVNVHN